MSEQLKITTPAEHNAVQCCNTTEATTTRGQSGRRMGEGGYYCAIAPQLLWLWWEISLKSQYQNRFMAATVTSRCKRATTPSLFLSLPHLLVGVTSFLCAPGHGQWDSLFLSVFLLIAVIKVFVVAAFSHMSHAASVSPRQPPAFCRLPAQLLDPSNEIAFSCRRQTQCKGCHRNKESAQYTFFTCKLKTDLSVISSQNQLIKKALIGSKLVKLLISQ